MGKLIDLTGQRFGRLVVLGREGKTKEGKATWRCICDCGKTIVSEGGHLRRGHVRSCGCYRKEILNANLSKRISETCDGHSKSRLYIIWQQMKMRCYNPRNDAYDWYGERGIKICTDWLDWDTFRNWALSHGYQDHLTIDRIDVNGNYEPSNCRWVDWYVQANNTSRNVILSFRGETHTASEWARSIGLPVGTIYSRLRYGWPVERALTEPVQKHRKKE